MGCSLVKLDSELGCVKVLCAKPKGELLIGQSWYLCKRNLRRRKPFTLLALVKLSVSLSPSSPEGHQ